MQITNSALPNDAAALSEAAASGVVVPYNAPTANDFEQVLRSVTPPTSGAATTTTPAATTATTPSATPATSAAIPTAATPTTAATPSAAASPYPYAGAYGAMMPAMYVPMMMPMAMMPATGSGATTTTAGGAVPAAGTPAVAGTVAPTGTPMAMAMVPMAMVPMGMMPLAGAPAMAGTTPATSGAATASTPGTTTAAASTGSTAAGTFRLPFQGTPQITQPFGPTAYAAEPAYAGYSHFHTGIDFALSTGTAVDAAGSGTVVAAGWDTTGFGNRVIIDHGNGVQTLYGHLSKVEVSAGQTIQAGQELGLSGSTGNSSGPHLHFGVEKDGRWVDPTPYLSGSVSTPAATDGATPASSVAGDPTAIGGAAATASPSSLPALVRQVAAQTGVSASLISAVVQAESAGNPHAVSSAGAKGLMQLMDATAAEYGVTDSFDPQQNVTAGAQYLAHLLSEFDGNQQLAVAAYNAGPGAVQQYGGIPPYPETQAYVQKVTALQQQYASSNGA